MSEEQLKAFWEAVEGDTSLQEKLSASTDGDIDTPIEVDAVIAIAKDAGFTITTGDLLRADAQAILKLSDEELEGVAGGRTRTLLNRTPEERNVHCDRFCRVILGRERW